MVKIRTSSCGVLLYLVFVLVQDFNLSSAQRDRDWPSERDRPLDRDRQVDRDRQIERDRQVERDNRSRRPVQRALMSPHNEDWRKKTISANLEATTTVSTLTTILRGDQPPIDDMPDYELSEFYPFWKHNSTVYRSTRTPYYRSHNNRVHRPPKVHPCEQSSCYPATGNLLIGRENRLYASSTCGSSGPERFCIVSHLEEKKCFLCDTRLETEHDPTNHRIGQIIYTRQPGTLTQSWWQSENGKENVTIQLDLEAEFHFTHLIIVFATFRPAAMLIERSYDFGKTWHVYKYFAHNCAESFPGVPRISKNITDVICDHRYSSVEPSKAGEVIYRVLPPNMKIENPYAQHVQNMLKMTNLRINFTKLHNLGDTLLDDRQEIQEKYYYAISNMVVRGSCSCYGHASRCLPLDGVINKFDMVHGRCECTHNTKGLNCEECEDFFNDLPWKPALGKQTNACKKCTCNNHATSCHFDPAVYDFSGRVSGGVCDKCQHNTQGQHCEECIPFFYRDPYEDIQSPHVCKACDCDPNGSLDEGICDSVSDPENDIEAGACHCKANVKGRRCDTCKDGFWNLVENNPLGCQNCTCNTLGTIDNSGCNMYNGECTCKRLVTGKDCNQCLPETYGLSDDRDGCSLCNCDPGGAIDNYCDVTSGQCTCRTHMTGRTCNIPKQNYFIPSLHTVIEAELPEYTECLTHTGYGNCSIISRQQPTDRRPYWTGPGYRRVPEDTELTFTIDHIPKTMTYDVVIRYLTQTRGDWEEARITLLRPEGYYDHIPDCYASQPHPAYETRVPFRLPEHETDVVAIKDICLEQNKVYKFRVHFVRHRQSEDNAAAEIYIDSLSLVPHIEVTPIFNGSAPSENRRREYVRHRCNETYYKIDYDITSQPECQDLLKTVSIFVYDGATSCECNPTGSTTKQCERFGGYCHCKPNVVGRKCDQCAPGTYGFGPEGCKACDCNSIGAKDNDCDLTSGQCTCHPNTYGRECDQCQPGFWNFPNCQMCQCNGHTSTCDPRSGQCLSCQDYTAGYNCERCIEGFYGNPLLGSEIGCRPCRCPDTIASGHSHADICELDRRTNDMICFCKEGYSGARCDICADNYFGNPEKPGGICEQCNCSNNINSRDIGNCDGKTGKCLKCLHDTTGDHCEYCSEGYFGQALKQDCRQCHCDVLGTNKTLKYCDRFSGQCPCLKNVNGLRCSECVPFHWKIASGEGCEACDCDSIGSISEQCNPYDGQCTCKAGFGGRQCNQCQTNFWGNPNVQCRPCDCNPYGAAQHQCNRETGQCVCHKGIGGYKCDQCDRGYLGQAPYCSPCGECFDNWDLILTELGNATNRAIEQAKQIKTVGATGAYSADFNAMDNKLNTIKQLLANTTVNSQDIKELENRIGQLRKHWQVSQDKLGSSEQILADVYAGINLASVQLENLRNKSDAIKSLSNELKENATQLQEANIEGALNLTRDALQRVHLLSTVRDEAQEFSANAERQCKRTETLVNRTQAEFEALIESNQKSIIDYQKELTKLQGAIPKLNNHMCDRNGDPCDTLCGGAGCEFCGGLSCERGALTRSEKALKVVNDTASAIKEKKEIADNLIRSLSQAKTNASEAYRIASVAHNDAEMFYNRTNKFIEQGTEFVTELTDIINNNTASPDEIRELAEKTTQLDLQLDPKEIKVLAKQIDEAVASLDDVEGIIQDTRHDLDRVDRLKTKANHAKEHADMILKTANEVVEALDEADLAQEKASTAIQQANVDINLAKQDLEKIDSETNDAELPAKQTAEKVDQLAKKLNKLHKNVVKNDLDAKEIKNQVDDVTDSANNAHQLATQLRNSFKHANNSLSDKAISSKSARERAQLLLQRASTLTVDTTGKLRELEAMTNIYQTNDRKLEDLRHQIGDLNDQMERHLKTIQENADRYRQCSS